MIHEEKKNWQYLKNIEVYGFKSFAQKINFEFHNGITGIVGPNGSGKSNVGDAVRWVLGEQSAKQLRGGNMQDVIFSGTENRKPLSFASVSITLDNIDHKLPVDYNEVTVTRRLYRSGESEYLINGSGCRLKDIQEMFYDTGIGKEGYSIIGQGQIDKILSGKPEERRELFDEAAGIVKFKRRKATTLKKLDEERQNLVRVTDILSELTKQLGPLEKQSETARIYLAKREELKELDVNLFLLDHQRTGELLKELEEKLEQAQRELNEAQAAYDQTKIEYDRLEQELEDLNHRLDTLKEENTEALRKGIENLEKHVENMKKFNICPVVALNKFITDTDAEIQIIADKCKELNVPMEVAEVWAKGGEGAEKLAILTSKVAEQCTCKFQPLYDWNWSIEKKIETVAKEIYGAVAVDYTAQAKSDLKKITALGLDKLPVCIAKTQKSLSDNPKLLGRPKDFIVTVRQLEIAAGAGFVIPITGEIMRMPGLPDVPAAEHIDIDENGQIRGLF